MSEYNLLVSSNDLKSAIDGEFHIEELLKQKSLDDIVRLEDNLNCDIKVLDSQMKNLVYENYNKLIQTSEIMQNMSSEFDEAQKKLILLENELINGFQQSTSLMAALKPYQQKYRNYQRSKCDLLLIEKIFALPDQLQKYLDAHAFANFIQHYEACIDTIEELAHHNNIAIVKDKIDQIVIKARKFLTNEITMESEELRLDTKNVSENFRYLNKLGGSSEDVVKIIQKIISDKLELSSCLHRSNSYEVGDAKKFITILHDIHQYILILTNELPTLMTELSKLLSPFLCHFIDILNSNLGKFRIVLENFELLVGNFENIYQHLSKLNNILGQTLSHNLLNFSKIVKKILISNSLAFSLKKTIGMLEERNSHFICLFRENNFTKHTSDSSAKTNILFVLEVKNTLNIFLGYFICLYEKPKYKNSFYQIFDHLFNIAIYSDFLYAYFIQFARKLDILVGDHRICDHPEILLNVSTILDMMISDLIPQFASNFDHKIHKTIINIYSEKARLFFTSYVQKYAENNFVVPILMYFEVFDTDSTRCEPPSDQLFSKLNQLIRIVSTFKDISSVTITSTNKIDFDFISSNGSSEIGLFDHAHDKFDIYDQNIDLSGSCIISSIYKIIAKSYLESFNLFYFTANQVIELQTEFYLTKKIFASFNVTTNKKLSVFEKLMLLNLKQQGLDQSQLLSLHELKVKIDGNQS